MIREKVPASVPSKITERLNEKLKDPEYASFYLNEAFQDDDEIVLKGAIASVIQARGVVRVAKKAGINRCTVFKTLKPETRTSFKTIHSLLRACGLDLKTRPLVEAKKKKSRSAVRS